MSNVVANPGLGGATFATDTIAGVDFPKNKLTYGIDGAYVDISTINGLPVQPATAASWLVTNANLDVALSTRLKPADTLAGVTTVAAVTAITNALPTGNNVIGHVIHDAGSTTVVTGNVTVVQPTGTNLHTVIDSGSLTANAGTNLNTSLLALEAGHLATIDTSTARIPVQGQALAAASLPVVLTAAQVATLTPPPAITGFMLDATFTGRINTLGQKTMATSMPVVLASDQSAVTVANPVNTIVTGTFTAADIVVGIPLGDGTIISGASTAGSVISLVIPDGMQAWTSQMTGWVNGTVYSEASLDSTNGTDGNWIDIKGRRTGTSPGIESVIYAQVASGIYRGNAAGFKYFRLRFVGGTTFPAVRVSLSNGQGATFLNSAIPGGTSNIGTFTLPTNAAQESGNLAYLAQTVEQNNQIIKFLAAILMTLGNNGNGFVDPSEADSISTLQ